MDANVPYLPSVTNLHKVLDKIQNAGVPEVFNIDFLRDLGFTNSNDRPVIKLFKYIGLLDASGRPQTAYREPPSSRGHMSLRMGSHGNVPIH